MSEIIGRKNEWEVLGKTWSLVVKGKPGVVFLEGPPGIGKTYLALGFLDYLQELEQEARPLIGRGRCVGLGKAPARLSPAFDAVRGVLEAYAPSEESREGSPTKGLAGRILGSKGFEAATEIVSELPLVGIAGLPLKLAKILWGGASPSRTGSPAYRQTPELLLRDVVLRASHERPLVLFLDDLHWTDPGTLELVVDLLRATCEDPGPSHLMLLSAFRTAEAEQLLAQLEPFIKRYDRRESRVVKRLVLKPMTVPEVAVIAQATYRGLQLASENLVAWLAEQTEGNPLAIAEILAGLRVDGLLVEREDQIVLVESLTRQKKAWVLGPRLRSWMTSKSRDPDLLELVLSSLRSLPGEILDLLRVASILGTRFWTALLAEVAERSELEVTRILRAIEGKGVVREAECQAMGLRLSGTFEFVSERTVRALRRDLSHRERQLLHGRAADVLLREREAVLSAKTQTGEQRMRAADPQLNERLEAEEQRLSSLSDEIAATLEPHLESAGRWVDAANLLAERVLRGAVMEAAEMEAIDGVFQAMRLQEERAHAELILGTLDANAEAVDLRKVMVAEAQLSQISARAEELSGRYDLALLAIEEAVRKARWAAEPELLHHLQYERARMLFESGDHRAARAAVEETLGDVEDWGSESRIGPLFDLLGMDHPQVAIARLTRLQQDLGALEHREVEQEVARRLLELRIEAALANARNDMAGVDDVGREAEAAGLGDIWVEKLLEKVRGYDNANLLAKIERERVTKFLECLDDGEGMGSEIDEDILLPETKLYLEISRKMLDAISANNSRNLESKARIAVARLILEMRKWIMMGLNIFQDPSEGVFDPWGPIRFSTDESAEMDEEIEEEDDEEDEEDGENLDGDGEDEEEEYACPVSEGGAVSHPQHELLRFLGEGPLKEETILQSLRTAIQAADSENLLDERILLRADALRLFSLKSGYLGESLADLEKFSSPDGPKWFVSTLSAKADEQSSTPEPDPELLFCVQEDEAQKQIATIEKIALAARATQPKWLPLASALKAFRAFHVERSEEARAAAEESEALAEQILERFAPKDAGEVAGWVSRAWNFAGEDAKAVAWAQRSLESALDSDDLSAADYARALILQLGGKATFKEGRHTAGPYVAGCPLEIHEMRQLLQESWIESDSQDRKAIKPLEKMRDFFAGQPYGLGLLDDIYAKIADHHCALARDAQAEEDPSGAEEHLRAMWDAAEKALDVCKSTRQWVRYLEELGRCTGFAASFAVTRWPEFFRERVRKAVELGNVACLEETLDDVIEHVQQPPDDDEGETVDRATVAAGAQELIEHSRSLLADLGVEELSMIWQRLLHDAFPPCSP